MPTVLLARHAQASFGAADYDVLSAIGVEQAAGLAGDLARRGVRIDRLISGSLARQRDTAAPIAAAAGVSAIVDPRWDEYLPDEILARHSDTDLRLEHTTGGARPGPSLAAPGTDAGPGQRIAAPGTAGPGRGVSAPVAETELGAAPLSSREFQDVLERALLQWIAAGADGPAGETWPAFAARAASALDNVLDDLGRGETALVCTSGGVLAALCVELLELPAPTLLAFNRVAVNTGVTRVIRGRAGTRLVSFNEHAHLERDGRSLVTYR